MTKLVIFLIAMLIPYQALGALSCYGPTKFFCSKDGCVKINQTVIVHLDPLTGDYSRCDDKGCNSYVVDVSVSGIFLNFTRPGTMAKVALDGAMYMEVATLKDTAYISFGECSEDK